MKKMILVMEQTESVPEASVSQCVLDSRVMPLVINHNSLDLKEVTKGHNVRDGKVPFSPERYTRSTTDKSSSLAKPNNIPQNSRRGQALTSAGMKPLSLVSCSPAEPSPAIDNETRPLPRTPNIHNEANRRAHTHMNIIPPSVMHISDDSSSSDFETSKTKTVIPASPPTTRGPLPVSQQTTPIAPSRLSRIRQSHLANKKRELMKTQATKLPELAENSELDTLSLHSSKSSINGSQTLVLGDSDNIGPEFTGKEGDIVLSASLDGSVTPNMPESFLQKLGLTIQSSSSDEKASVDQLSEKEIESKFVSLSLAFKTDKLTLDQRVSVQERSRDLAEKNVDAELQVLSDAVENLGESVTDAQGRCVLHKLKRHILILEQLVAKVSSRAEVFGAVQQERRMCKAMEVMILYSENVRRIREKEESELQEARKLLSERSGNGYRLDSESSPNRRSMSIGGLNSIGRPVRRRSEVALPRVLGGSGSPSMSPTANLDARSRFQSAVASTSMQQIITTTMRQCSLEKEKQLSPSFSSSSSSPVNSTSKVLQSTSSSTLSVNLESMPGGLSESQDDKMETGSNASQEEEAFRKGFREGLKAKLSQELNDLRDQQNSISNILEHVMDKVDKSETEDEENLSRRSLFEVALSITSKIGGHILQYDWRSNKAVIRNLTGIILILLAFAVIFFCPPIPTEVRHFAKPS